MLKAINDYKASSMYAWAKEGDAYSKKQNTAIMRFQKLLYTITGEAVPDNFTANHKCASNFFSRFVTQENQYLLGNGVNFEKDDTKKKLSNRKYDFDTQMQKLGKKAITQGVSYGFVNLDHVEVFEALEFVPLWDEEDGALKAGIRFWQIADNKPLRMTLYELDGYTEYIKRKGEDIQVLQDKRAYVIKTKSSEADGVEIYESSNYIGFPIVPLWGNPEHQSALVGIKEQIDAYDLIKSGFANDLDDASMIYWTIENAGGMEDIDLVKFVERMKTLKATIIDSEGAKAEAHTIDVPYSAREAYLTRLRNDLYEDAMALDTKAVSSGNVSITATAIRASYEALNNKTDEFEYCVIEFIDNALELLGIEDTPTFKRSVIVNQTEETTMILAAAQYLDDETVLKHLPFLSSDEIDGILDNLVREEANRYTSQRESVPEGQPGASETNEGGNVDEAD